MPDLNCGPQVVRVVFSQPQLWCQDCQEVLTPTDFNPQGFLFCMLARHRLVAAHELIGLDRLEQLVESAFAGASYSSNGAGDPNLTALRSPGEAGARVAGVLSLESTATLGGGTAAQVTTLESMVEQVMLARGASVVLVPIAEGFGL